MGIIGGGIGGLYAALMLQDAGIPYEILEASDRLGGRLFTRHFSPSPGGLPKEYDYYVRGIFEYNVGLALTLFVAFGLGCRSNAVPQDQSHGPSLRSL